MAPPNITTTLAAETDAGAIASIMTCAFSASDTAYPLIWAGPEAPEGIHDEVAMRGLFSPVQQDYRLTFKAVDGDRVVGFATWGLPKPNLEVHATERHSQVEKSEQLPKEAQSELPDIPGVNTALWREKVDGSKEAAKRDVDAEKDMQLSFFFVHPDYQGQGIGTLLLQWGMIKADETNSKIWLTSTPQAVKTYERNGWKTMQKFNIDLGKQGGLGNYSRAWMLRLPSGNVVLD